MFGSILCAGCILATDDNIMSGVFYSFDITFLEMIFTLSKMKL